MERERVHSLTIRERRKQASQWFNFRVFLLLAMIVGLGYSAWLSPWAKASGPVRVEIGHVETSR